MIGKMNRTNGFFIVRQQNGIFFFSKTALLWNRSPITGNDFGIVSGNVSNFNLIIAIIFLNCKYI